jgi:hypothetical protein
VRERAGDVGVGQAPIEIHRRRVSLDALGHGLAETAGPSGCGRGVNGRLRVGHGERFDCSAGQERSGA